MLIDDLANLFSKFPGIGPRQSKRFVYFLLRQNKNFLDDLVKNLTALKKETSTCEECMRFFPNPRNVAICEICSKPTKDRSIIMIVEKDIDLENVERSGVFEGVYFILGGTVPLTDESPDKYIRTEKLLKRTEKALKEDRLSEIIIATNATTEGDHTALYLDKILLPIAKEHNLKITHLGRGLSTGTELEYSDKDTLRNALINRH